MYRLPPLGIARIASCKQPSDNVEGKLGVPLGGKGTGVALLKSKRIVTVPLTVLWEPELVFWVETLASLLFAYLRSQRVTAN